MADSRLFEKTTESPDGTISDPTMRLAYGKASTPTLNITLTAFITWIVAQLTSLFFMKGSNNLSELTSPATARQNLNAANKYISFINNSALAGGSLANPVPINIDPTTYDVLNLTSSASASYYRLPNSSEFSIPVGTHIMIRSLNGANKILVKTGIDKQDHHTWIYPFGMVEFYWDGSLWNMIDWNTYLEFKDS